MPQAKRGHSQQATPPPDPECIKQAPAGDSEREGRAQSRHSDSWGLDPEQPLRSDNWPLGNRHQASLFHTPAQAVKEGRG